jgi:hypothetical protein
LISEKYRENVRVGKIGYIFENMLCAAKPHNVTGKTYEFDDQLYSADEFAATKIM